MQRYFANFNNGNIILSVEDQRHLLTVLRSRIGEQIEAVINDKLFIGKIQSLSPLVIKAIEEINDSSEMKQNVCLYYCLSKGDKNDFVIQKATELGAKRIVLVSSKRCVVKYENKDVNKKIERYTKIAKEAAEQCHRLIVPKIEGPVDIKMLKNFVQEDHLFVAYEEDKNEPAFNPEHNMDSIGVLIGSEGGLEKEEISILNEIGFKNISLGKRILRTETAAVYVLSVISNAFER